MNLQYLSLILTNAGCETGAGDGSVNLFDLRTGGSIVRLPLSSTWEVIPFLTLEILFMLCETQIVNLI